MHRRLFVTIVALAALAPMASADAAHRVDPEGALKRAEALLGLRGGSEAAVGRREATLAMRDLAVALHRLDGTQRQRGERVLARPDQAADGDSFGNEDPASPLCDTRLCVHWAAALRSNGSPNRHAPEGADTAPANGIPDFVDETMAAASHSFAVENGVLGWRTARPDGRRGSRGGAGRDGQVDLYLVDLPRGIFGYAAPDPGQRGRSRSGYLVVDNDFRGFSGAPLDLMRVTVAHEYNHILQFAYDTFQDGWLFEATATWVEEHAYPAIDDYFNFLPPFVNGPHLPLAEQDGAARKLYGSAMWKHWLSAERGAAVVRDTWAVSSAVRPRHFALAAIDRAIKRAGGRSFSRDFAAFAAATAEWNSSTSFPDAGAYREMRRSGRLGTRPERTRLDHTAYRLYRVRARGDLRLVAKVQRRTRAAIALVGRTGPRGGGAVVSRLRYLPRGGRGVVRLPGAGRFGRVTAVLVNADGRNGKLRARGRNYSRDDRRFLARIAR